MKHTPSHIIVNCTYEYSQFDMILGNRELNQAKIKKIIKEITSGNDMLKYYPIQVSEDKDKLRIIDGQHRFAICKQLKVAVYYIIVKENKSIVDIARVNSNVEKWKLANFLECYIIKGDKNYVTLKKFIAKYPFSIGFAASLLEVGYRAKDGSNEETLSRFCAGEFKTHKEAEANEIAELCNLFPSFENRFHRTFIAAILKIKECGLITIEDLGTRVNARPELLTHQANYKNYIYKLEEIYNVGKHSRVVIYAKAEKPVKEKKVKEKKQPALKVPAVKKKLKSVPPPRKVSGRRSRPIKKGRTIEKNTKQKTSSSKKKYR